MFERPWVARDARQRTVADRLPPEFGRGGLAEKHCTVLAKPGRRRRIFIPGSGCRTEPRPFESGPSLCENHILDCRGNTVDRTAGDTPHSPPCSFPALTPHTPRAPPHTTRPLT